MLSLTNFGMQLQWLFAYDIDLLKERHGVIADGMDLVENINQNSVAL